MDWKDIATVELPIGTQTGDLLSVTEQLEMQTKAVLSSKRDDDTPHVKALSPVVADALEVMIEARNALRLVEAKRAATAAGAGNPEQTIAANDAADDAWRSIENLLDAGRTLRDNSSPGAAEAEALYARLFDAEGLRFINYRPRRQWDVAQRLIAILQEPASTALLHAIGGERHLKALLKTHREFGIAFGFSAATSVSPESTSNTRDEQLALQSALREYVLKVAAQVSPRIKGSAELARFLLAPYTAMVDDLAKVPRSRKKPAPTEPKPA